MLLRNLHALYAALEQALEQHAGHASVEPVRLAALGRSAALAHDAQALHGAGWAQRLAVMPAMRDYCDRLQALAQRQPQLLAAHAYVRYLGDLSGGQVLRRIVSGSDALGGPGAVRFYEFGTPAEVAALAARLRAGLEALPGDDTLAAQLLAEARQAFAWHKTLFEQLADQGSGA